MNGKKIKNNNLHKNDKPTLQNLCIVTLLPYYGLRTKLFSIMVNKKIPIIDNQVIAAYFLIDDLVKIIEEHNFVSIKT